MESDKVSELDLAYTVSYMDYNWKFHISLRL